ncbi:MAG TPA: hypothetical protein VER17_11890, partial [Tepidisphaeraceae bacterium]|nr:hypothetical protein [Tepidisphaeraceae bacterium]
AGSEGNPIPTRTPATASGRSGPTPKRRIYRTSRSRLTLSNLPEHYALQLALSAVLFDFSEGTGRPRPKVTISTSGSEREIYSTTWPALAPFEHTGDSVAITLTGANFSTADSERWMLEHLSVRVLRYRASFALPQLTVQHEEPEPVPVTVLREDGTEVNGADLSVVRQDNLEASIASGQGGGPALNLTGGAKLAAASLVLQLAGGGKLAATTAVAPVTVSVLQLAQPAPGQTFGAGQTTVFDISATDANNRPLNNTTHPAPVAALGTPPGGGKIPALTLSVSADPVNTANWKLTVTCNAFVPPQAWVIPVLITYPTNPPTVAPITVFVSLTAYTLTVATTGPRSFNSPGVLPIKATVTTPWGAPVPGVTVTSALTILGPAKSGATNPGIVLQPASVVTTASGTAMFWLSGAIPFAEFRPIGYWYRADFKLGNDISTVTTVSGNIK